LNLRDLGSVVSTHDAAAFSSQRSTVFQAFCWTRAIEDLFKPSTLIAATSSNIVRRCWRR
jgi:hypothetical protein